MPKEVRIVLSEEEYDLLKKVKGNLSWKNFLLQHRKYDVREVLAYEITSGFEELKSRIAGTMQDGVLMGLLEIVRVMCIKIAKMDPEKRDIAVEKVKLELDKLLKKI